jgi:hypothetical protein
METGLWRIDKKMATLMEPLLSQREKAVTAAVNHELEV